MIPMNWKKETSANAVYPEGTYYVRIVSHERVKASTGTPQIRWRAEIISPEEFRGRTILEHTPLTEASLWRTANFVASCGVDTMDCPTVDINSASFDGILNACNERKVYWQVVEETGLNGKQRNTVVDYKQDNEQPTIKPQSPESWS